MTTTRKATTHWEGTLMQGSGSVSMDSSGIGTFAVNWPSRAETPNGKTSPEELIAAAHSSCFSMALSHGLATAGTPATAIDTTVEVDFQPGEGITGIRIFVSGSAEGLDAAGFAEAAKDAKENCPVSKALSAVPITLSVS